jgi:hypothetical protein
MRLAPSAAVSSLLLTLATLLPTWLPGAPPGVPSVVAERAGTILVGTDRGLWVARGQGWSLAAARGAVLDVATGDEAVWVATDRALWAWPDRAEPRAVAIAAGARVAGVASAGDGTTWVATEVGLFRRTRGARDFVRETSIPAGRVLAVRAAGDEVWAASRGRLWRREAGASFEPVVGSQQEGRFELCDAASVGDATLVCVPRGLWRVDASGATWVALAEASLRSLARTGETLWVASDRGLIGYALASLDGVATPSPTQAPVSGPAHSVRVFGEQLLVATRGGVARIPLGASGTSAPGLRRAGPAGDEADALRRAVLAYQGLGTGTLERAEQRAERAALLPFVRASLALDRDYARGRDSDQAFSTGAVRHLLDTASDRSQDTSLELQLSWDLERLRDPGHTIAISRERRERIELRDQILDRVNRLYFERQRVLARLRALPDGSAAERNDLEIRERELRAGLDGWSGGAFSELVSTSPARSGSVR